MLGFLITESPTESHSHEVKELLRTKTQTYMNWGSGHHGMGGVMKYRKSERIKQMIQDLVGRQLGKATSQALTFKYPTGNSSSVLCSLKNAGRSSLK